MSVTSDKVNSVTIRGDMLEEIAATNHLAVEDVVRLFLLEALLELERKLGPSELSPASPRRFTHKRTLPR
jgi:hypothetical protein